MNKEKNRFSIIIGPCEKQKGDVVLNWATHSFCLGPNSFYKLLKASGGQPFDAITTFKANISNGELKQSDVLSTIAGKLNFNLIIHALIPETTTYSLVWRNIISTLKIYKKENVCRDLYITIPDWADVIDNISNFSDYQELIEDMHYVFIVDNLQEKMYLEGILNSYIKKEKENKVLIFLDKFIKKIVVKISSISISDLFFKSDEYNKKKL